MKKLEMYRQGDVLIQRVRSIPKAAKPKARDNGRIVLAYGEVTGHAHAIADLNALLLDNDGDLYLEADGSVTLSHEEHATIDVPAGKYRVVRQSEYSPEMVRSVAD